MDAADLTGHSLDGKYRIERELGRGGMGTVYLATHLGTERPVAVKVISPEYMQRGEFVERFRREARAAGRLRHPNVVNVTDFGFAETSGGQVAYLVMEYLDGCTLGEILDEEKNLPVGWTLDILEQVCSAVHEAHAQGIIHRDLKPDNIWLEPNQRGGYTVKVLDFGIAKLEEHEAHAAINGDMPGVFEPAAPTIGGGAGATFAGGREGTKPDAAAGTQTSDAVTVAQTGGADSEAGTMLLDARKSESETARFDDGDISAEFGAGSRASAAAKAPTGSRTSAHSLYESGSSAELTRVGAVLGTPLYMSPEQCRGEHLDPRSDIYSLGVIAYQMLSGTPPFAGDFKAVMEAHQTIEPPPLRAKKVRRKLKRVIHSALKKDPRERPQSAEALASELRSRSEGIFDLLRRALVIWSEHLPKFVMLTTFFSLPIIILTVMMLALLFLRVSEIIPSVTAGVGLGLVGAALWIASAFCTNIVVGSIAWIVAQHLAVPLRPIRLRPALHEVRRKWKRFAGAGILTAILPFVVSSVAAMAGFVVFAAIPGILYPFTGSVNAIIVTGAIGAGLAGTVGFFLAYISWILVPPVVMMENVRIIEALRRSRRLVKRSFATAAGAVCMMFLIPAIVAGSISFIVNITAKALDPKPATVAAAGTEAQPAGEPSAAEPPAEEGPEINWSFGRSKTAVEETGEKDMRTRLKETLLESLVQIFWLPMQILVFSFSGIIVALLYLKTRLAGGESMNDLIERFEDDGLPKKKWQERVRQRLIQSGRISSNPSR